MTFKPPPGFIPPFQDLQTLAAHTSIGTATIEELVRAGRFPQPRKNKCGKRLWVLSEVEDFLAAPDNDPAEKGGPVYEATRRATGG